MKRAIAALVSILTAAVALSGCFGANAEAFDPLDFEATGRVVELKAWVEDHQQEVYPGFTAGFWAFCVEPLEGSEGAVEYNSQGRPCSVPGPTIRVQQGDTVKVTFENPHGFPHTIHWHGQLIDNEDDGVPGATQDTVLPDGSYVYEYVAERPGTLLYHCHVDTQHHVMMGLYGVIIVEPQDARLEPEVDKEYTFALSHANRTNMDAATGGHEHHGGGDGSGDGAAGGGSGTPGEQNAPFDFTPDVFMINGKSFPNTLKAEDTLITVNEGDRVRIRLANIGYTTESMHLHGHDMLVTHKDGLPLSEEARYKADTLALAPGERYDVLVVAENPGKWAFHTHFPTHVANHDRYPGGMLTQFVYVGFEDQEFAAELPGGPGAGDPGMTMTHVNGHNFSEPVTSVQYTNAHKIPVPADTSRIAAQLGLASGSPLDDLDVTLLDPGGEERGTFTLDAETTNGTIAVAEGPFPVGDWSLEVAGRGVQASYTANVTVEWLMHMGGGGSGGGGQHDH